MYTMNRLDDPQRRHLLALAAIEHDPRPSEGANLHHPSAAPLATTPEPTPRKSRPEASIRRANAGSLCLDANCLEVADWRLVSIFAARPNDIVDRGLSGRQAEAGQFVRREGRFGRLARGCCGPRSSPMGRREPPASRGLWEAEGEKLGPHLAVFAPPVPRPGAWPRETTPGINTASDPSSRMPAGPSTYGVATG